MVKRILILVCVFSIINNSFVFAKEFTDMVYESHWAYEALKYTYDKGYIRGFDDNTIRPDSCLTRAQMAAILVRAYGKGEKGDISMFSDVSVTSWYYDVFCEAVKMGLFKGDGGNRLYPENDITRQEAFVVLAQLVKADPVDGDTLFLDDADIAFWSKGFIKSMHEKKYIYGINNYIFPLSTITRAEFAQLIYNIEKNHYNNETNMEAVGGTGYSLSGNSGESGSFSNNDFNITKPEEGVLFDGDYYKDDIFND